MVGAMSDSPQRADLSENRSRPTAVFTWNGVVAGAARSLLIAPSVCAFALAVGIMAASRGLTTPELALMSTWVAAGGAQMAMMQIWTEPLPLLSLVLTTLAMNARYILLGAALHPWLGKLPGWQIYPTLFTMGDGNWALSMREFYQRRVDAGFFLGSGVVLWLLWIAATVAGHLLGQVLSDPRQYGLDFMLAAFFATMAVTFFRAARGLTPLIVAVIVAILIERYVPGPWYIFAGALAGSLAGVIRRVDAA